MDDTYLWGRWSPPRLLVLSFAAAIVAGTVLLRSAWAADGDLLTWLDALFTATSAVCVTGLTVVETGTRLSPAGQAVILALIQLGGLGIMTFSTLGLVLMGKRVRLLDRVVVLDSLTSRPRGDLRAVVLGVAGTTLAFEALGAVLLAWRWPADSLLGAAWTGLFHAVSAFCNAGFGLLPDSLGAFRADPVVNLTGVALILAGGIGFPVITDLVGRLRPVGRQQRRFLSLHTKMVLAVSGALIVLGAVAIYLLESSHALREMPPAERWMVAAFQTVTARTAGFTTIATDALTTPTLFILAMLMFIGGSPGSTAGGIKTTALGTLAALTWARLRARDSVDLFRRTIPEADVRRAVAVLLAAGAALALGLFLLLLCEEEAAAAGAAAPRPFLGLLFEATSALGTVGLSTGVTPTLTPAGKLVIVALMFAGRTGPLTVALALGPVRRRGTFRYPEEHVLVG